MLARIVNAARKKRAVVILKINHGVVQVAAIAGKQKNNVMTNVRMEKLNVKYLKKTVKKFAAALNLQNVSVAKTLELVAMIKIKRIHGAAVMAKNVEMLKENVQIPLFAKKVM